jgi:hypothetical protein
MDEERLQHRQPDNPDFLSIIKKETKTFRRSIKHIWVKGHQKVSTPISSGKRCSTNDIKGNNRADELATWYRELSGKRQSTERVDHVSESMISISLNGVRLVSQVEECLRYHVDGYHLRQYIQSKYQWSNQTWAKIDVEAIGIFHRRLPTNQQIARTKFIFDQWHTGTRRYQVATVKDPLLLVCPCCKSETETVSHVLRCSKNPDLEKCILQMRKALSPKEYHPVFSLIKEGVSNWLRGEPNTLDITNFPMKCHDHASSGIRDQENIGWHAAFKGYLSVEWRQLASMGLGDNDMSHDGRGMQYIRSIMKTLMQFTQDMWKARNHVLHGTQDIDMRRIRQSELAEIIAIRDHPELLPAGDRHYCEQTLENIVNRAPATRRRWLRHMRAARVKFTRDGRRQTLLTNYYSTMKLSHGN